MNKYNYVTVLDKLMSYGMLQNGKVKFGSISSYTAGADFVADHYDEIVHAIRLAQKITQTPSEPMVDAYIAQKHAALVEDTAICKFNAMIEQALKELEQ